MKGEFFQKRRHQKCVVTIEEKEAITPIKPRV